MRPSAIAMPTVSRKAEVLGGRQPLGPGCKHDLFDRGLTLMVLSLKRDLDGRMAWYLFHARATAWARCASPWPKEMFSPGTSWSVIIMTAAAAATRVLMSFKSAS